MLADGISTVNSSLSGHLLARNFGKYILKLPTIKTRNIGTYLFSINVIRKLGNNMDNIVFREAGIDDAEEMISYLNIVGRESDNLMHGSNGFNVPIEAVKQRIQAFHDADNSVIMIAMQHIV